MISSSVASLTACSGWRWRWLAARQLYASIRVADRLSREPAVGPRSQATELTTHSRSSSRNGGSGWWWWVPTVPAVAVSCDRLMLMKGPSLYLADVNRMRHASKWASAYHWTNGGGCQSSVSYERSASFVSCAPDLIIGHNPHRARMLPEAGEKIWRDLQIKTAFAATTTANSLEGQ